MNLTLHVDITAEAIRIVKEEINEKLTFIWLNVIDYWMDKTISSNNWSRCKFEITDDAVVWKWIDKNMYQEEVIIGIGTLPHEAWMARVDFKKGKEIQPFSFDLTLVSPPKEVNKGYNYD